MTTITSAAPGCAWLRNHMACSRSNTAPTPWVLPVLAAAAARVPSHMLLHGMHLPPSILLCRGFTARIRYVRMHACDAGSSRGGALPRQPVAMVRTSPNPRPRRVASHSSTGARLRTGRRRCRSWCRRLRPRRRSRATTGQAFSRCVQRVGRGCAAGGIVTLGCRQVWGGAGPPSCLPTCQRLQAMLPGRRAARVLTHQVHCGVQDGRLHSLHTSEHCALRTC